MRKLVTAAFFAAAMSLCLAAADHRSKLPTLPGEPIKTTWGGPAVAANQNGVYTIAAVLNKDTIHYTGFKIRMSGDLAKQAISFKLASTTPEKTRAFYVRCFDKQNKCVASWKTWSAPIAVKPVEIAVTAHQDFRSLQWEQEMVKSTGTAFEQIEFIFGTRSPAGTVYDAQVSKIELCAPTKAKAISRVAIPGELSSEGFELLGIPAKSAELRGSIAYMENGRHYLLTRPQDHGPTGYLLLSDLDSGKTEQYFNPPGIRQSDNFGSILTSKGLFLYDHGGRVVLFDTKTREYKLLGKPDSTVGHFMVYTEAPDGTVYLGGYPQATITAWDPQTGQFRNYGRMDPKEAYLNMIATDKNGYVYCGIGSARANLVALDPKTGKVTQIIPENMRGLGYGQAYSGTDGYAYVAYGKFRAKMLDGKIVATDYTPPPFKNILAAKYGGRLWQYEDGTRVTGVDLYKNIITYQGIDGKKRDIPFSYKSGGLYYTSMGGDGKGKVFGSTCHPMHFVEYNANTGKLTDHGPHTIVSGGNFCNMTYSKDGIVYMCEYAGGRLWQFNPDKPYTGDGKVLPTIPGAAELKELIENGKAEKGHFTRVNSSLLLCFGDQEGARFTFPFKVEKSGKKYLNILAYEHGVYGTATFEFQGITRKVNLQNINDRARVITLGPVDLKEGTVSVSATVRSHGGSSRAMFGLIAMGLAEQPFKLPKVRKDNSNPQILGAWPQKVTRPRAVQIHPDGKHVVIAGYAGYGLCGGSFGIHNLETNTNTVLSDWLPGHSCITFCFAENGDIIGGTDIAAPGGGYKIATKPAIFRIDWKTRKVVASTEIDNTGYVMDVELWNGKLYAALSDSRVLVADPKTMKIERTFASNGGGYPVRNAFQKTPDNRLFLLQSFCISEFHPETGNMIPRCRPAKGISTGGTNYKDHIYFACHVHYARWKIPAPLK